MDSVYSVEERTIYSYYKGEKEGIVKVDPMEIHKRMMEVHGDLVANHTIAFSPAQVKDAAEIHTKLIEQIRQVFEIVPFKEGGLTQTECVGLLHHWWTWCSEVKKNSTKSPSSSEETSDSSPSPSADAQTTTSTSESG